MLGEGLCFVEWKEQYVTQERGNRVVHYILKDSAGESFLAIVGTERSVRHMFYVVAEEFVQSYGAEIGIHSGFKWRSRREVVDWLTSMISKPCELTDNDSALASGSYELPVKEARSQVYVGSILNGGNSGFAWSGAPWSCVKQLKHYGSFCRNGISIAVYSFVYVMGKGDTNYLAYLEDMYEDKRGQKKVKVRWFHCSDEVKGVVPLRNPHKKEVFITPYAQVISAECVGGPATILTKEHYFKYLAGFPGALSSKVHMCFRQFKNNRVKNFDLSKLQGYFNQPAITCLLSSSLLTPDSARNGFTEEDEDLSPSDEVKVGSKRARSGRGYQKSVTVYSSFRNSGEDPATPNGGTAKRAKYAVAGKRLLSPAHVYSIPASAFRVDSKIETLCQDSGIRGCWFRCTVLQVTSKQLKVHYDDLLDEDGSSNLEEWIPAVKFAIPDRLAMRFSDRLTIRPVPPAVDETEVVYDIGVAVDAWWSDGWWEGVVIGYKADNVGDILQIYFPGENLFMSFPKKDLRKSMDWVGDRWINVQTKLDISSILTAELLWSASPGILKIIKPEGVVAQDTNLILKNTIDKVKPNSTLISSEVKDKTKRKEIKRDDGNHKMGDSSNNVKEGEKNSQEACDDGAGDPSQMTLRIPPWKTDPSSHNPEVVEMSEAVA